MPNLLILTAMRSELVPGLTALGPGQPVSVPAPAEVRRHGHVLAGWSGMGRGPTEKALRALAGEVDAVLHLGVGGGLRPGLRAGNPLLIERAFHGEQEVGWETPASLLPALGKLPVGAALTVDAVAGKPSQKRALAEAYDADIVEMETFWAARVASELGIPYAAVRVVCDGLDDDLPDLSAQLDAVGRPRPLALLGRLARKPSTIARLPGMASAFGAAQERLGGLIRDTLAHIAQV